MEDNKSTPEERDSIQSIITEDELLQLTGVKKGQLADFRNKKRLPFLKINQKCRLYLERDVVAWLKKSRVVINADAE